MLWSVSFFVAFTHRTSAFLHSRQLGHFHASSALYLNRILLTQDEIDADNRIAVLSKEDYRTVHAAKTLGLHNGASVRAGIVSCDDHAGLCTDVATVRWIPEGKVKKAEPLGNGKPPGSLCIELNALGPPPETLDTSKVSLILALPRPLQLGRMLPMIAQMGVDKLVLTHAKKVPKDYFGSHLFRKPEQLTEKLVEGLCQAGDVRLPEVHIVRNLRHFLTAELDELFPRSDFARAIAHPQRQGEDQNQIKKMRNISFPNDEAKKVVVAIGPEGGWEEPEELERFECHGFQQVSLGARILRSDCAVVSLLSLAHDSCSDC